VSATPLVHNTNNAATGGIWRVTGDGGTRVLKVARPPGAVDPDAAWPTSAEPAHWNFWRREVFAYESGLAASVYADEGIHSPALLDVVERDGGEVEVWLSDVVGVPGTGWSPERLGAFARQLGAAQARYAGRVPDLPWLSRGWLGQYLVQGPIRRIAISEEQWAYATEWPPAVVASVRRLWAQRARVLAVAMRAQRTLCHLDVWPNNLIDDGSSVLLDWAFVGEGGVGEDAANLIVDSVTDGLMDIGLLPEIAERVLDGYCSGVGNDVRAAVRAYGAAKYCWFAPALVAGAARGRPVGSPNYGGTQPAQAAMRRLEPLVTMLAAWSDATLG
jgi:hypothetical protein